MHLVDIFSCLTVCTFHERCCAANSGPAITAALYERTGVGSWARLPHSTQRIKCIPWRKEVGNYNRKSFFCLISNEGQQPAKGQFKYIREEFGRKHRHIFRENLALFTWSCAWTTKYVCVDWSSIILKFHCTWCHIPKTGIFGIPLTQSGALDSGKCWASCGIRDWIGPEPVVWRQHWRGDPVYLFLIKPQLTNMSRHC